MDNISSQDSYSYFIENPTKMQKAQRWVYENPTTVKVVKIALKVIGAILLTTLPVALPIWGCTAVVIGVGVVSTILGGVCLLVSNS